VSDVRAFEDGLHQFFETAQQALLADMTNKKQLDDDVRSRLHAAIKEYAAQFKAELETVHS
jgi:F-type H+-transporting ATPase subunit alpha